MYIIYVVYLSRTNGPWDKINHKVIRKDIQSGQSISLRLFPQNEPIFSPKCSWNPSLMFVKKTGSISQVLYINYLVFNQLEENPQLEISQFF